VNAVKSIEQKTPQPHHRAQRADRPGAGNQNGPLPPGRATRLGLNATDLKCLDLLRQTQTPLTAANLAALTGLTGGAITGVADRLEAAGFVERVRDRADRRRWELRPKPDCQHEIGALLTPLTDAMAMLCAD
jgi:DNA-binding MarR family transcriptional regulator